MSSQFVDSITMAFKNGVLALAFSILVFLALKTNVSGLRCYECYSKTNGECGTSFSNDPKYESECVGDQVCALVTDDKNFEFYTSRGCRPFDYCQTVDMMDCSICKYNLCNGNKTTVYSIFD